MLPRNRTYYRVYFPGDGVDWATSPFSSYVRVTPVPSVSTPVAPATMSHLRFYTLWGYLSPAHASRTYPVRVYRYRYVSGAWKSYGYVLARSYSYNASTSQYLGSVRLPYAGRWRLRAYALADGQHAAAWSKGFDYVTVR